MAGYLLFTDVSKTVNIAAFNTLNTTISLALGYPNTKKTSTYAKKLCAADGVRIAMGIIDTVLIYLTAPQVAAIVSSLPDDWAPQEPMTPMS